MELTSTRRYLAVSVAVIVVQLCLEPAALAAASCGINPMSTVADVARQAGQWNEAATLIDVSPFQTFLF